MFFSRLRLFLYGLIFISVCMNMNAKVNLDSIDFKQSTISQISDFDGDSYQDTLISMRYNGVFYPYYITWHNNGATTQRTYFKLPEYENYTLKMNCLCLNEDNMKDLLFSVTSFKRNDKNRLVQDTSYNTVIFAQSALKTLDTIKICPVVGLVYSPIIQANYQVLVQSKIKTDYSNGYSFNIAKCNTTQPSKHNSENDIQNSLILNIFPNPVSNTLNISIRNMDNEQYSYRIMNSLGELLVNCDNFDTKNSYSGSVNFDKFANGMYLFALYHDQQVIAIKTFMVSK